MRLMSMARRMNFILVVANAVVIVTTTAAGRLRAN